MDCNKVILVGRVGKDPVSGVTGKNNKKAFLRLATHRFNPNAASEAEKETTEWHDIIFFKNRAEKVMEEVKQGMLLRVEGSIHYYNVKNEAGIIRKTEIWGVDFGPVAKDEVVNIEVTQSVKAITAVPTIEAVESASEVGSFNEELATVSTPKTFAQLLEEENA